MKSQLCYYNNIVIFITFLVIILHQGQSTTNNNNNNNNRDFSTQWNIFGSNQQLPTFHLRPFQNIRSIIQEIGNDNGDESTFQKDTVTVSQDDDDQNIPPPWRHHIDFDEKHPGEDLIAVETLRQEDNSPVVIVDQYEGVGEEEAENNRRTPSTSRGHRNPFEDFMTTAHNSDSDDSFLPFQFPPNLDSRLDNLGSFWTKWFQPAVKPWWKGANVCIKREEEDGLISTDEDEMLAESDSLVRGESLNDDGEDDGQLPSFHFKFSSCEEKDEMHLCETHLIGPNINKTIRMEYECCPGYLLNAKTKSCERGTLKPIGNTLVDIGAKEFSRLINIVGLDAKLMNENLTIFVPTDDAIASFMQSNRDIESNEITIALEREELMRRRRNVMMQQQPFYSSEQIHPINNPSRSPNPLPETTNTDWRSNALSQQNEWARRSGRQQQQHGSSRTRTTTNNDIVTYSHSDNNQNLQQLLLNHMIQRKLSTNDFVDEKVLFSENKDNGVLRLNTWDVNSEKVNTINCARLVSVNHRCSNGMIHMINRMIRPVTKSIADIVTSEEELTTLKSLISMSGLLSTLRDPDQHFTLFAPTNAAINKLGPIMLSKLRNGDPCLKRIMRNHILPMTLCTSIITQKGTVRNLNHGVMSMERTSDDKLFVNGSQIITRDIVTTNGIIHIIDAVLTTELDSPIVEALEKGGFTNFLDKLERVGLKNMLNDFNNITVFAPSNTAMELLPREVLSNTTRLRDILLYHIAEPETRACHFTHEQLLKTKLNNRSIRINLHSMLFPMKITPSEVTAQCGMLKYINRPSCNGIIHTIDRVLIPSDMNLLETLQTQNDFSIFTRLLLETDLAETLKGMVPYTVYSPTDAAFYKLPKEKLETILKDKNESLKVLKLHIVKDNICCGSISPQMWFMTRRAETLNGLHIPIFRDSNGQVTIGTSKVSVCDLTASNGVVHSIDSVISMDKMENPNEYMQSCLMHDFGLQFSD